MECVVGDQTTGEAGSPPCVVRIEGGYSPEGA